MSEKKIKTICYGKVQTWSSRKQAINFYERAMAMSEGSEYERYRNILTKLKMGMTECSDDVF